ncbi:hypothetical protein Taro_055553, partial [Colocasia esculenta]|nr:hypothetical protein [Colocasia esculenta]
MPPRFIPLLNWRGMTHNVNENFELHDAPQMNDEVLENSESDGDDVNEDIQSLSDDDVNDDTNVNRPMTDSLHVVNECVSRDMTNWVGLRIDGEPVVAAPQVPDRWPSYLEMCQELLGIDILNLNVLGQYKSCLQMVFLRDTFSQMNLQGHNMHTVRCYTRAYVMYLLGKALLPDTSGNEIHIQYLGFLEDFNDCGKLSWGSVVLAYLYRQLT